MNLYLRLLLVLARALRRAGTLDPLGESVLRFRVLPNDLDLNLHVNNGRYFTLMDLGRVDLVTRLGLLRPIVRNRWMPVVAGATMRFKRSLGPFERFSLHTRLLCWDEKWFYLEQRFERGGRVVAEGVVRGVFKAPGGLATTAEVIASTGRPVPASPPVPQHVALWVAGLDGQPAEAAVGEAGARRAAR